MLQFYCSRPARSASILVQVPVCVRLMLYRNARQYDNMLIVVQYSGFVNLEFSRRSIVRRTPTCFDAFFVTSPTCFFEIHLVIYGYLQYSSNIGQLSTDVSLMTISKSLSVDLSPNRNSWYLEKLPWSAFVEYQFETLLPSSFSSGVEMYFWFELSVAMQAGASLRFFRKKKKNRMLS